MDHVPEGLVQDLELRAEAAEARAEKAEARWAELRGWLKENVNNPYHRSVKPYETVIHHMDRLASVEAVRVTEGE